MNVLSDQELIEKVLSGEDAFYGQLVNRYQRAVYSVAIRYLRQHEAGDDVAQETFIRAYFSLKTYDNRYRFYTWLLRITINLCHDAAKKQQKYIPLNDLQIQASDNPLENVAQQDSCNKIREEIDRLPADQRDILLLRVDRELSYEEISKVLNIPLGTVMSRLFRGRKTLMERLKYII